MTPQTIITQARYELNDTDSSAYRQSNDELVEYVNAGIQEVAKYKPEIFSTLGDMTCTQDQVEQAITFADASMLLDVVCIHDGRALRRFDRRVMDDFRPNWRSDTSAAAQQWAPLDNDPLQFYIYPPAPASQVLDIRYSRIPTTVALGDTIGDLPETYEPALVDYVIYRAEMKDDESVLNQRATSRYNSFLTKIGIMKGSEYGKSQLKK